MNHKEAKVIMLGGCPRTGKTTLSVRLVKSGMGFSKISGDFLGETNMNNFEFVKFLIGGLLDEAQVYNINSVFDYCSYDFTPTDMNKLPFKDRLDIYFFGFPDISTEEIRYYIKHHAVSTDWIYHVDDDYVEKTAKRIYAHNIELKELCRQYNYRFINTGVGEKRNVILNSLYEEIMKKSWENAEE